MSLRILPIAAIAIGFCLGPAFATTLAQGAGTSQNPKQGSRTKSQAVKPFSWDSIAEIGHTSSDTLQFLKSSAPSMSAQDESPTGHGPQGVTLNPPTWPIPPGATGYNGNLAPNETGIVVNGVPKGEDFSLMIPSAYNPLAPPPLVIAWHGYGTSNNQPMFFPLPTEANNRGWLLYAPLGVADNTFSWLPGQVAVDKTLEWLRANYPFDESRVYGIGLSMGAMCITNYAARHQDPANVRFAAVATVCGTFDNVDNYIQSPPTQALMQSLFGGAPFNTPYTFEYERVHMLRLPTPSFPPYLPVDAETPARSLLHIPFYMTWSADDNVVPYSPVHNSSLFSYLVTNGNPPIALPKSGLPMKHSWAVLDVVDCFNFFSPKTLNPHPALFTILTDKTGAFNDVTISGGTASAFKRFDLNANSGNALVSITNTNNLDGLTIALEPFGFGPDGDFTLASSTLDSTGDSIVLVNTNNPNPPSKVRVGGVDDYSWSFDLTTSQTTIPAGGALQITDILYTTFDMSLGLTGTPSIGSPVTFDLVGGQDGEAYGLLYSGPGTSYIPLALFGDGDPRYLLLDLFTFDALGGGTLANGGQDHLGATIPNEPFLIGSTFNLQALTVPGSSAGIPHIVGRISNQFPLTVQ